MGEQKKEWLERYRPVRHRTGRSKTTKDKAGARDVFAIQRTGNESEERLPFPEEIDIIRSANSVPQPFVRIQFVDDGDVSETFEAFTKRMNIRQILMTTKPKMKSI